MRIAGVLEIAEVQKNLAQSRSDRGQSENVPEEEGVVEMGSRIQERFAWVGIDTRD